MRSIATTSVYVVSETYARAERHHHASNTLAVFTTVEEANKYAETHVKRIERAAKGEATEEEKNYFMLHDFHDYYGTGQGWYANGARSWTVYWAVLPPDDPRWNLEIEESNQVKVEKLLIEGTAEEAVMFAPMNGALIDRVQRERRCSVEYDG